MRITLGIELWISCIATGTLYNYATSMHSMVISQFNTRYIGTETYTSVAQYLLVSASCAGPAAPQALAMTSLVRTSTSISRMLALHWQVTDLESASWLPMESRLGLNVAPLAATAALP